MLLKKIHCFKALFTVDMCGIKQCNCNENTEKVFRFNKTIVSVFIKVYNISKKKKLNNFLYASLTIKKLIFYES